MSACCHEYPFCNCKSSSLPAPTIEEANTFAGTQKIERKPLSISDYDVPTSKTEDVLAYYTKLRKKHLHIPQARLVKKVVEYFHLKKKVSA